MATQTYMVAQWRGTDHGYRSLGSSLTEAAAIRRMALIGRLFPEYAAPKAYAEQIGNTDVLAVTRRYQ